MHIRIPLLQLYYQHSITLPPPSPENVLPQEFISKNQHWRSIEHRASKRRGLEQSKIWDQAPIMNAKNT